jgi:hypothetical protein
MCCETEEGARLKGAAARSSYRRDRIRFWQALETPEIRRTLDFGFQSSAMMPYENSLYSSARSRKDPNVWAFRTMAPDSRDP